MKLGTVILFNHENGYGIIRDDGSNKYFFHYHKLQTEGPKSLCEGQRVYFHCLENDKKPFASIAMIKQCRMP